MRILVISDTHGKNERVYDVYNKLASAGGPAARSGGLSGGVSSGLSDCLFGSRPAPQPGSHRTPPVDMIVHCGDYYADAQEIRARLGIPVLAVKGNCDGCFDFEACSLLETECGDILITHGHMEDVGFSMQKLYYKVLESGCIGAFFGHTHRSVFVETGGVCLLNPGSLSQPRDGSGGTFALVTTSEAGLQAKIYYYEDFMLPAAGVGSTGGGADAPDNSAADNSAAGGTASAPETPVSPASPAASPVAPAVQKPKQKPKVKGGHLRSLINYSDRF
jgi:phosphodiesterase family protein